MSNIGKKITDDYCNGYFGRLWDFAESRIEAEGYDWIVIRTMMGVVHLATFKSVEYKQLNINNWTTAE